MDTNSDHGLLKYNVVFQKHGLRFYLHHLTIRRTTSAYHLLIKLHHLHTRQISPTRHLFTSYFRLQSPVVSIGDLPAVNMPSYHTFIRTLFLQM